jgi:hypothetical protein
MIKFEEQDGKLFRMLDKPEAINEFSKTPCVIACKYGGLKKYYILDSPPSNPSMSMLAEGFEIIGYPVEEGSRWWALYQMMQGKKVSHKGAIGNVYLALNQDGNVQYYDMDNLAYIGRIISKLEFGKKDAVKTGWQIYKEPESQYKVGDWVEYKKGKHYQVYSVHDGCCYLSYGKGCGCFSALNSDITRKLDPSEVVIHIGCLSGAVKDLSYVEDGRFWFIGKKTERCPGGMHCILYLEMLDTQTRELVESLLKAQKEEQSD